MEKFQTYISSTSVSYRTDTSPIHHKPTLNQHDFAWSSLGQKTISETDKLAYPSHLEISEIETSTTLPQATYFKRLGK